MEVKRLKSREKMTEKKLVLPDSPDWMCWNVKNHTWRTKMCQRIKKKTNIYIQLFAATHLSPSFCVFLASFVVPCLRDMVSLLMDYEFMLKNTGNPQTTYGCIRISHRTASCIISALFTLTETRTFGDSICPPHAFISKLTYYCVISGEACGTFWHFLNNIINWLKLILLCKYR